MSDNSDAMKKRNYELVESVVASQYWLPENRDVFADDFTLESPNSPPGMPQMFNPVDAMLHMDWLTRTVRTWEVKPGFEIYGTGDQNLFWVVRECSGDVHWAGVDGKFESRIVSKIIIENGRIRHMKELANPLSYLKAIGAEVPIFRVEMDLEEIEKQKTEMGKGKIPVAPMDNSPEAIAERTANNLAVFTGDQNVTGEMATYADEFETKVFFLPPEMKDAYYGDEKIGIEIWSNRSVISLRYLPDGIIYETDRPETYFVECGADCITEWQGNDIRGAYRNRYVMHMVFENGAIKLHHEYLNPVNKFNSINKSIPSFPYYF